MFGISLTNLIFILIVLFSLIIGNLIDNRVNRKHK